jgi:uncharacterized SAM-binding protein YcdF (DUF218 family)
MTVRSRRWLGLALLVSPALYIGALYAAEPLFAMRTPVRAADVIVVLGGDGPARATRAAAVYRQIAGARPRVLVTGDADCLDIARLMIGDGVPPDRITVECASRNTWENATFSRPLLAKMGAESGILVTSWFHMRRAVGCFRAVNPAIDWGLAPVERRRPPWEIAWDMEGAAAAKEYLKVPWYALRYGLPTALADGLRGLFGPGV